MRHRPRQRRRGAFRRPGSPKRPKACFIVRDATGRRSLYVYFEEEPGRRSAAHLLTRDEARRINATNCPSC